MVDTMLNQEAPVRQERQPQRLRQVLCGSLVLRPRNTCFLLTPAVRRVILRVMMKRQRITLSNDVCHVSNRVSGQLQISPETGAPAACAQSPTDKRDRRALIPQGVSRSVRIFVQNGGPTQQSYKAMSRITACPL